MVDIWFHKLNLQIIFVFYIFSLVPYAGLQSTNLITIKPQNVPPVFDISFCSRVAIDCHKYASCLTCHFPNNCKYGDEIIANCTTNKICLQQFNIYRDTVCKFCWQVEPENYDCETLRNCSTTSVKLHRTICRVKEHVVCKGRRTFFKNIRCNWTNGYSWWKAMFLSVTLGGFGVDRFYLGLWKSAIGKLFSFGGLGLWTLIDIILIGVGYIGPADGSAYI